jgi:hypothetical protein
VRRRARRTERNGDVSTTPSQASTSASDVLVLKLHGSMNWPVSILDGALKGPFSAVTARRTLDLGDLPVCRMAEDPARAIQEREYFG